MSGQVDPATQNLGNLATFLRSRPRASFVVPQIPRFSKSPTGGTASEEAEGTGVLLRYPKLEGWRSQ